jgi:uncharacterized SAM-binding protein YcdF (DUF218 family)
MNRKKLPRWIICSSFILTTIALLQTIYTLYIFLQYNSLQPADAVLVFAGNINRIETGYKIVNEGYADSLIVSPEVPEKIAEYNKRFNLRQTAITIIEDHAMTTFENALYTDKLVEAYNFRNVILVTSDFHMPRSYFIMRLLTGPGVRIQRYSVYKINESDSSWERLIQKWRLLMFEMIQLYGTLAQLAIYPLTNLQ